ncbi:MAG: dihydrodipicolinate synthase family protein [Planctomycetales bacterium]|nr:dihydrodipicolinate synthase family protein [Planctomycetales bacterium]
MPAPRLTGLIAAAYTPLDELGKVNRRAIHAMTEHLVRDGVDGLYVCGSTGEGMSLSSAERREVAEGYVAAVGRRMPVVIQVGHNSLAEAWELARHAESIGVDAVSATCPSYFPINSVETLVDCMADIAVGAPNLPFYYYHIPALTHSQLDMVEFLRAAAKRIPNLAGIKYTAPTTHEFQACMSLDDGRFDVVWGCDEMLLPALAVGSAGAIGSTYNIAAPLYRSLISAFERHDLVEARHLQMRSIELIRALGAFPFHSAMKATLRLLGIDCGVCRLPQQPLTDQQVAALRDRLSAIGFFEWRESISHESGVSAT